MKTQTKHRIIGGIVLLALIAIFLPILFHNAMPSASSSNAPNTPKPQVILQLPDQQQAAAAPIKTQTQAPTPMQTAVATQSVLPQNQSAVATPSVLPQTQNQASVTTLPSLATNTAENTVPPVNPPVSTPTLKAAKTATSIGTCTANAVDCSTNHAIPIKTIASTPASTSSTSTSITSVKVTHARTSTAIQPEPAQPASTNMQSKNPAPSSNDIMGSFSAPRAWVIQLASFSEKQNAKKLINHLRKVGYEAYSRASLDRSGRLLIHVYVGPEIQHDKILKLQQRLRAEFHLNGIVRKYTV